MSEDIEEQDGPGLPGPLRTWPAVYAAVLLHLLAWILLFIWITEVYG